MRRLFEFLEFNTLFDRLAEALDTDLGPSAAEAEVLEAEVDVARRRGRRPPRCSPRSPATTTPLALAAAWTGVEGRSDLEGLALVRDGASRRRRVAPGRAARRRRGPRRARRRWPAPDGRPLAAHQAKPLVRALTGLDVDVRSLALDTALAAYLLDPAESRYLLEELVVRYAGARIPDGDAAAEGQLDLEGSATPASTATARRALAVDRLVAPLLAALDAQGLRALNDEIEVPLVGVLARMEDAGVAVDRDELQRLRDRLVADVERHRAAIVEAAGHDFNVNSTLQLREVLFDELGLAPQKKTKTGFSTDAASLEKLAGQHPIIEHLLAYREVEKLRSTYGDGLLQEVARRRPHPRHLQPDGGAHRPAVVRPAQPPQHPGALRAGARVPQGVRARRGLRAAGRRLQPDRAALHRPPRRGPRVSSTASSRGRDIHTETASRIFGVEAADVTIEMRSKAKMVSYGLAYGMEAYGLGQRLNIPTEEAAEILDAYFVAFPAVKAYMERTVAEARERGYTETLFGRRRQIPELASSNFRIRQAGERQAMNAGIQGLAADIFKVALVRLDERLAERGGRAAG